MLELYFSYKGVLKRLRSGALGDEMDRLAEHFFTLGYKRASAKSYLSRIAHLASLPGRAAVRCRSIKMSSIAICARLLRILRALVQYRR